ncbi:carboxymuconolactone decarboxylase family protein [Dasania marina]|uniref:carboxymuconolactone decarboxylase family protein n=1 Tax=Dasania marina TaxID=471499 RepID=UPI000363E97A|nr:carboxymuconolactone decarboxylase family protein [Dasania marina]
MAHMQPLPPEQLAPFQEAFAAMSERMGFVPNSLKTLARKPKLLQLFMAFALETSKDDTLSMQLKYLAGLIASAASGCSYCQAHLSVTAAREDITDEKIAAVWEFETSAHL